MRPSSPAHVNFFPWTWPLGELLTDPSTFYLENAFEPRMCELIVKTNGYASVTIHHAPNAADSSLTIEIYRMFIPYLAAKVFNLTIVDRQPGWTALSGNGDGPDIEVDGDNSYTIRRHIVMPPLPIQNQIIRCLNATGTCNGFLCVV